MKDHTLMRALSCIHPKFIHEGEFDSISKASGHSYRRLIVVALAACLVFALAVTAYAANLYGLRELFRTQTRELPEEALPFVQTETVATEASTGWSCAITESLSDNATVMATVTISGGDQYIIAPTYVGPDDSVMEIGLAGDQTLGEYAQAQGKKLLLVGASIKTIGGKAAGNGSQRMQSLSDSEMVILTQANKTISGANLEAVCRVYALEAGTDDVQRIDLPFTLTMAPATAEEIVYRAEVPDAIPGLTVGELHITKSALGYNLRMPETVTDQDAYYNIMKIDVDGLTYGEGGGSVLGDDGNWYFEAQMCQGSLSDPLTIRYYDWEKEPIGDIVFRRVSQ